MHDVGKDNIDSLIEYFEDELASIGIEIQSKSEQLKRIGAEIEETRGRWERVRKELEDLESRRAEGYATLRRLRAFRDR